MKNVHSEDSCEFFPNRETTLRKEYGHLYLIPDPYLLLFFQVLCEASGVK